ncbi:MAG: NAD-dependent epimerase/dehydratase family protein [Caldilineaceae bacterium]|nr:NAD-dependent epimerase/dehydratase family protein [Caldilineaceae bacterium]
MTRAIIIGGSGHVGTYLVPRLVEAGFDVVNVSRGARDPYQAHGAWSQVEQVIVDRVAAEAAGDFGPQIAALQPDIVIDMICFTLESAQHLTRALQGKVQHFLHCGTVWIHGHSAVVPTVESQSRAPFGEYGIQKSLIEIYLMDQARRHGFPATAIHPGHIVGPGWAPLNPEGHFDLRVFSDLAQGNEILIPNLGQETVHHVHADDVAQAFMQAIIYRSTAVGESFHAVSPAAVSLRGYAEAVAGWFGREANVRYLPWPDWEAQRSETDAAATWSHIAHSPSCSIEKGRRLIAYQPRYTSFQAVHEAVQWLVADGSIQTSAS